MGCATSKLDDSPAVVLCRDRCAFLDEAVKQRFAFAEAHLAYLHSLKAVGLSLDRFFNQDLQASPDAPPSPVLNLPAQRKGDPSPPQPSDSPPDKIQHHLHSPSNSHSDSGSHLHFHSDDSEDEHASDSESLHHHEVSSSLHHQNLPYGVYLPDYDNLNLNLPGPGTGGFMNINYMKNQTTPSLVYTQRPMSPETMHMGESSAPSSSSSSYYPYSNYSSNNLNPNPSYPFYNFNSNYNGYPNYGSGGGFFGASSSPPASYGGGFSSSAAVASTSKAPPPPPSPPSSSAWDFLNPFESFEKYYPPYTPSRDSREVREEEGIPDLEDEEDEVVKEVHGDQKFVDSGRSSYSKPGVSEEDSRVVNDAELQYRARPSVGMESDPVEYEVHMVDKKVVDAEEKSKDRGNAAGYKARGGFKGDSEVVREIQVQFERASESGNELAKFLEVGKIPYKRKHGGHHVSSKILHLPVMSSQPSTSKSSDGADPALLDDDQEVLLRSRSLSSTLHKLYLWEKKLYEEVKVEEKMRVLHEQKSRRLKRLDEKGAEPHKIDATRTLVRSLSTKIRIAIQVVDKISVKINTLRDEELWPQLNEFIQGLTRMWKSMLECHHNQCEAIGEAKRLDAIAFRKHFSDGHFEATRQLEHDLINWTLRFSYWVGAQKGYVRALNNWLMKCLLYVPEETPDGIVPFSPGRIGAPPVFVVCNQWWQSLERISEKEVVDSMRDFASNVLQLWDRDKAEMRQRMLANKDDRKIKSLDKEDQKIQKEIQALDKRMVLISADSNGMPLTGHVVYQSETTKGGVCRQACNMFLRLWSGLLLTH
ncbi:protein ROLLING AND ERECT LEAF 2 [Sesamum angolense]|uniref:Protein ROLLING AND ERECT LEAF 2 n=1 Tax=Sesamum angolense TaxID=2727404 RepID=A0AAE2BXP3_9LAMI|nr:protein ROLLING AND ERECT LEAF 2 [Sesamum angolense]